MATIIIHHLGKHQKHKDMEINPEAKKLAGQITDYVNTFSREANSQFAQALSEKLANEHRTLQQSTLRLFLETIEMMAGDDYRTDPRNEASKTTARRLMTGFAKVVAQEQGMSEEEVVKNWDVYKPSKWLGFV